MELQRERGDESHGQQEVLRPGGDGGGQQDADGALPGREHHQLLVQDGEDRVGQVDLAAEGAGQGHKGQESQQVEGEHAKGGRGTVGRGQAWAGRPTISLLLLRTHVAV